MIPGPRFNRAPRLLLATLPLVLCVTAGSLTAQRCCAQSAQPTVRDFENTSAIVHEPLEPSVNVSAEDDMGREAVHALPAIDPAEDVRAMFRQYVADFNEQNAHAMISKWKHSGVFIDRATGLRTFGRESILQHLQTLFESRNDLVMGGRLDNVRFVRPDVACVTGFVTTASDEDEPLESNFTAIAVRDDGAWLFDSVEEAPLASTPSPDGRLSKLEFLVGRWQDIDGEEAVMTNTRWGENRSFLVRSYWIADGSSTSDQSTEVIGWDLHQGVIRSWTFHSDGSFGESVWHERESGWDVKMKQTLADGRIAAATQAIMVIDQDTLSVQRIGEEIAGSMRPSRPPVRVVRISDTEASDTK